ncbi:MBL fold metallo-hydrolase [Glaciecola sp. MF2-115]|uniref:MBL fold metallo-hydrolase n=1 Tax=Glaciecola sp. MF2-115 TaxID=3384827 RepID=UPI0039A01802
MQNKNATFKISYKVRKASFVCIFCFICTVSANAFGHGKALSSHTALSSQTAHSEQKTISSTETTSTHKAHSHNESLSDHKAHNYKEPLQQKTPATATYLANEGILISTDKVKVLFDPFFHNDYNIYQLVPDETLKAIMNNETPYNDISAIFVSHAHGDHFAEQDMLDYMLKHSAVELVAPAQAITEMQELSGFEKVKSRITKIELAYEEAPISFSVNDIKVDAVRIPHAGWPGRADVSNIVYRVRLPHEMDGNKDELTFIHMGDADPNDKHFRPLRTFWEAQKTTVAFPPYWFFLTNTGNYILDYRINAEKSVGVHVPKQVPVPLLQSGKPYFSKPGEVMEIGTEVK